MGPDTSTDTAVETIGSAAGTADHANVDARTGIRRTLWTLAGTFFLCLGVVGIAIPLLPTTPFLLLAAACYLRGSARMHSWMMTNKVFGEYLRNYAEGRGVSWRVKTSTVAFLWAVIGLSAAFATESAVVRIGLVVIAIAVSVHVLRIRPY